LRIDEALAESKPLAVRFGQGELKIEYRPPSYTIDEMVAADADKENPERLVKMLQDLIVGWDLTRIEKTPDDRAVGGFIEREIPVDITSAEDVRKYVPNNIIMGIIKAIRADNDVSGE
jgi:hypothetical protein